MTAQTATIEPPSGTLFTVPNALPEPPASSHVKLQRRHTNGLLRVSPLTGIHYIEFLWRLHRQRQVGRYLEIGTQRGVSLGCAAGRAIAIDPHFLLDKATWAARPDTHLFEMTSDDFFAAHDPHSVLGGPIDLAFIDGMHLSEFVLRDFINVEQ
ncbi:MAG TPA: class I SAM-dependent methyltransferase, partial [Rhodopila sp.]|nr:class I SAM-dependent methyltransferase [Rhodopila sp.]